MKVRAVFAFSVLVLMLVSCETKYKKLPGGIEYKIISNGKGAVIKEGNTFEFTPYAIYTKKDSILLTDDNRINQMGLLDSTKINPNFYKIFKEIREGDSVIVRERTDSILAQGNPIPWMKKGYQIIQSFKIQKIYTDSNGVAEAQKRIMAVARAKDSIRYIKQQKEDSIAAAKQIITDDKLVKDYLAKNKINATKTAKGIYIEMITPGTGVITDSNAVSVKYTGKNFKGDLFDSNVDPKFQHVKPMWVYLFYPGQVIKGWEDGIRQLNKGAKARLYIPSALAYGKDGRGEGSGIGPDENLIFDIEIVDVVDKAKGLVLHKAEMAERQAQMMQQQQMQQQMQQMQQQQKMQQQKGK